MTEVIGPVEGLSFQTMDELGADYLKCLIYGLQGSGKTLLASTVAQLGPCLFIDLKGEKGVRSFAGAPWEKNIRISRPKTVQDLDDMFWVLAQGNHPFKSVVIDSATAVQKLTMRFLLGHDESAVREIRRGTAPADIRTWGQSLDIMTDLATYWFGLADADSFKPMHVVMTAQVATVENEVDGITERLPDVQKGARSMFLANPDYILYTQAEDNVEYVGDDTLPPKVHTVLFGAHPGYRTKARVPYNLQGKLPSVLGRPPAPATDLVRLAQALGVGGMPKPAPAKKTAAAPAAATN